MYIAYIYIDKCNDSVFRNRYFTNKVLTVLILFNILIELYGKYVHIILFSMVVIFLCSLLLHL